MVLDGAPRRLQNKTLLWVQGRGFDRGDTEELVVEKVDVVDEMGVSGVHGARSCSVAVEAVRLREQAPPEVESFIYAPPAR